MSEAERGVDDAEDADEDEALGFRTRSAHLGFKPEG